MNMKKWMMVVLTGMIFFAPKIFFAQQQNAVPVQAKVREISRNFLKKNARDLSLSVYRIEKQALSANAAVYVVHLRPSGFLVISPASPHPVLAFSFRNNFGMRNDERAFTLPLLLQEYHGQQQVSAEQVKNTAVEKTWGPYVHTMWGQVNCYDQNSNLIDVTNYYTPGHYAVGCVAISLSTVLHYYRWPLKGTGSHTYTDSRGSSTGTYTAVFSNDHYKWDQMLDRYKYKRSTEAQRQAVGELAFHVAIALSTDFEPNGSTSNVNRIPNAGKNYFRFSGLEKQPSSKSFWDIMDSNLSHRIPVIIAIKNSTGGGHSVVCDGLRIDENDNYYYHLNMGWWGSSNGWYRIRDSWDAGGYNAVTDGVFYFLPLPQLQTPFYSKGQKRIFVTWTYPHRLSVDAFELQEKINTGSWKTISNNIQDTLYRVDVLAGKKQYFRVRAEIAGRWPYNQWSNVEKMTEKDVTGVEDNVSETEITLGPNPASAEITIGFGSFHPVKVKVYNVFGQVVFSGQVSPEIKSYRLSVGNLRQGLYFIYLKDKENRYQIKKFIKQ
jgi:hypothetical protein